MKVRDWDVVFTIYTSGIDADDLLKNHRNRIINALRKDSRLEHLVRVDCKTKLLGNTAIMTTHWTSKDNILSTSPDETVYNHA